jgi:3',5'-cyclic AMP phosphodiesterase CpdA
MKKIRIAVISDLHCHPEDSDSKNNETILFTDKLRNVSKEHPVENLIEAKENFKIENVDIVLCPGDLANQSNKQGLISGWDFVLEVGDIFNAKNIYATIGNHDVDSRLKFSSNSYTFLRGIKKSYPFKNSEIKNFWSDGYEFIENDDFRLLIINTSHSHTHSVTKNDEINNPSIKGKVEVSIIEEIEKYLSSNKDEKIKIMLCHHHPQQHSRNKLGEHDFVENGQDLLEVLGKQKFDLIIHGHKHDPWFGEHLTTNGDKLNILSSGSFSATNQIQYCGRFNYIHFIEIEKNETKTLGIISTFNFVNRAGWSLKKNNFYPKIGFGINDSMQSVVNEILLVLKPNKPKNWEEIICLVPNLNYLTPNQIDELEILFKKNKIMIAPSLTDNPEKMILHE